MDNALHELIRDAFRYESTDVFLVAGEPPRIRREGDVVELHPVPIPVEAMASFWESCGVDVDKTAETDVSWELENCGRVRVNLYRTLGRLAAVLRPIRKDIPSLADLSLPAGLLESWMQRKNGLVLITGPTGSGKSTTVAACLEWINQQMCRHIVTLEDPIEFLFENENCLFSQREMRLDSKDFATGLRSALRQSPDVLFIGEIRDAETALTALQAAETGHLVVSTLHSGGAVETVNRFTNLLGENEAEGLNLLASQLIGVVSQQLLPRKGGGVFPALEYLQNMAATRRWIMEKRMPELQDHLNKGDEETNCSALDYLVAAVRQDYLEENVARGACARSQDFDRAMKGFS
ncbi:MAG: type IV pilus twitching motility protein PilT [Luteolibacter sp.]